MIRRFLVIVGVVSLLAVIPSSAQAFSTDYCGHGSKNVGLGRFVYHQGGGNHWHYNNGWRLRHYHLQQHVTYYLVWAEAHWVEHKHCPLH